MTIAVDLGRKATKPTNQLCCPFELSPLNELWKACALNNSYIYDIWYTYISNQDDMSHARMVAPPCYLFEIYLNEPYRRKLVSSTIDIIPCLLALTLNIISSKLAVCNCFIIYFEVGGFAIPSDFSAIKL